MDQHSSDDLQPWDAGKSPDSDVSTLECNAVMAESMFYSPIVSDVAICAIYFVNLGAVATEVGDQGAEPLLSSCGRLVCGAFIERPSLSLRSCEHCPHGMQAVSSLASSLPATDDHANPYASMPTKVAAVLADMAEHAAQEKR